MAKKTQEANEKKIEKEILALIENLINKCHEHSLPIVLNASLYEERIAAHTGGKTTCLGLTSLLKESILKRQPEDTN